MKVIYDLKDSDYQNIPVSELSISFHQNENRIDAIHYHRFQKRWVALASVEINKSEYKDSQWLNFLTGNNTIVDKQLLHYSSEFTLIPNEYFDPALLTQYYTLNFVREPTDQVLSNNVDTIKSQLVYPIRLVDISVSTLIQPQQRRHVSELFIRVLTGAFIPDKTFVFSFIRLHKLFVYCIKNNELVLANAFRVEKDEDILYHLANVSKQLGYDLKNDVYYFSGDLEKTDPLYNLLYTYILDMRFAGYPEGYNLSSCFDNLQPSTIFHLLLPGLCE